MMGHTRALEAPVPMKGLPHHASLRSGCVAVIAARGGSKGLPRKNILPLAGKPLIAYTIEAALGAGVLDRVIVSTEDEEIAAVARAYGADVPFRRPRELARDETVVYPVLAHAIDWLREHGGAPAYVLLLQPTSPLRTAFDIAEAVRLALRTDADAVVSVAPAPHHPYWMKRITDDGRLADYVAVDQRPSRRQELPPVYALNGAIYLAKTERLLERQTFYTDRTYAYVMPLERSLDIDTPHDLQAAESLLLARGHTAGPVEIAGRRVGAGAPCFIIAEAGVNHNGEVELACRLIDAAADAGADAVKFQTFSAERLATADAPKAGYQIETTGPSESQRAMLRRLELSADAHRRLIDHCRRRGILFLSTPFDAESADRLEALGVPAFKLPSGELTNLPFLAHVARKGKPLIVSTGMSTLAEVAAAVRVIREAGNDHLILLHCVSRYPADPADANLRAMRTLAETFQVPAGYSDHTPGLEAALAAAALGACVIEKHLTLDRALPGPDHRASIEPAELDALVRGVRTVESSLGHGRKEPAAGEAETARAVRKSLVAAQDIPRGALLTAGMLAVKRPGTGLPPALAGELIGRRAAADIAAGTVLSWDLVDSSAQGATERMTEEADDGCRSS